MLKIIQLNQDTAHDWEAQNKHVGHQLALPCIITIGTALSRGAPLHEAELKLSECARRQLGAVTVRGSPGLSIARTPSQHVDACSASESSMAWKADDVQTMQEHAHPCPIFMSS